MEIKEEEPAMSEVPLKDMALTQSDGSAPAPATFVTPFFKPCAILLDGLDGPVLGGKELGVSDIETRILLRRRADSDAWMGFSLELPLGQANEEEGFGMCYKINPQTRRVVPADTRRITIKFPRDGFQRFVEPVSDALRARFPSVKKEMTLVHVSLKDASLTKVHGFGVPFKNNGHPSEDWFRGQIVAGDRTLFDVLQSDSFKFVVRESIISVEKCWNTNRLPPPFAFPYGNAHRWNKEAYEKMLAENKGHQFLESWSYPDDNAHLSALTQSQVQDVMWLDQAAAEIRHLRFSTYFIESEPGTKYFAIVATPKSFREKFASALRLLFKDGPFQLRLFDSLEDDKAAAVGKWDARIVHNPKKIDALDGHMSAEDTALLVRRPPPEEASRGPGFMNCAALDINVQLTDFERKVNAVCNFHPDAEPTNFVGHMSEEVKFRMTLHRDLLRGTGFYDTLIRGTTADRHLPWDDTPVPMPRTLPVGSLLNTDQDRTEALMEEALPNDRARKYSPHTTF
ncbi:hypothetical protein NM208_g5772 [Fusarium decemcellulare]|uniref:Uncharacterized protein n=1 Tax=Fusarium decemcellulare TaxID=57161 RepID=A0ACC1SFJ7_9HYPO|nr:hypothetical protein NM208_g5772 [Fusarium decemcellulare]